MLISSKREFYRLWSTGVLGNRLRVWPYAEWLRDHYGDLSLVTLRMAGTEGGGVCRYDLPPAAAVLLVDRCGLDPDRLWVHECAPDHAQTVQGEICRDLWGWHGLLGRSGIRMRDAIATGQLRPMSGLAVKLVLDTFMDASSRDDIEAILDLYPDAAIEFTCYERELGFLPNRNTVIWEVRHY